MKKNQVLEKVIHGIFLLLGLITVGCVLLITIYLVISGIPAIREIGLVDFLFGKEWASTASEPKYGILPFFLTSVYGTAGAILIGVPVDFMTAEAAPLPYEVLNKTMTRIINEVKGVNRVFYDLTSKPPGTIEFE